MARRLQREWQEDKATLKQLSLEEKDAQHRPKRQALWPLRRGRTIAEVAEMVGKRPRTIQDWIAWYRQGGLEQALRHRRGGRGGRQSYLSGEHMAELTRAAAEGRLRCVQDGMQWAQEQHGVTYP
ncbi:helix-turn-helix domain-containing protein [Roseiflexus sp.]|uniref:helix-turn-helix domain-containing protein n=1 Tax=Roseiflexus sp. TaxID=2562120 RepID=UPI0021DDEF6C|nr:helix-turn-helix domain-containing protein [Roseiflexus sp.]GIV82870.1 MAG: hypothetical protein KatS3mg051_2224 [Anaerolineae bacterium]GIV82878.1 MAG: hypothetical protein KatS3mg051_2232 [Anaerolineae bacterium]GIW02117.1 MAG: hypothetical protein KatS3mg058_3520 [Roseiflexus sp.]GIW02124.1 MAG: hypothetical protein KatS3mg058_3527 [Roseiflexus sp.]